MTQVLMDDLIYRQAAIDAVRKCSVKEVTPAYMLINKVEAMTELILLPSAQPVIISTPSYTASVGVPMEYAPIVRCKDCKFYRECGCQRAFVYPEPDDFCSRAERRTDE